VERLLNPDRFARCHCQNIVSAVRGSRKRRKYKSGIAALPDMGAAIASECDPKEMKGDQCEHRSGPTDLSTIGPLKAKMLKSLRNERTPLQINRLTNLR
jgi:hypothetical protein